MRHTKESGMTVVELLITLFVASAFLISGFQLYTAIIRDGGESRAQARASSVVDDYLKQYKLEATEYCTEQTPLVNEPIESEGLNSATISVTITCPYSGNMGISKIEVILVYGAAENVVATAGYVSLEDPSLVAWWPMDGNADDRMGDNDGTVNGASLTYDRFGEPNSAYSFDGINDYISIPGTWGGSSFSEVTISAWVKTKSDTGTFAALVQPTDSAFVHMQLNSAGANRVYTDLGYADAPLAPQSPIGTWKHVVINSKSGSTALYVDGVQEGAASTHSFNNITSTNSLQLGRGHSGERYLNGAMDDVRIYDRALTSQEIQNLYGDGTTAPSIQDDIAGWWPLTEDANDHSANSNHGTVSGATLTGGYDGTPDGAYSFDGADDVIAIPNSDAINTAASYSEKTVSLWFHPHSTDGKQILYEQGGTVKGLNLYIDSGSLYVGGWSLSDEDATTPWGSTHLSTNIAPGSWNHVVLTLDAASSITGYLNGQSFDSSTNVGNLFTHTGDINLGGLGDSTVLHDGEYSLPATFNGAIDDLKLWNRALTASEVTDLYNAGSSSELFGLVGWWQMNGDHYDATSSGLAGTVNGATLAIGQNGQSNGAYSFDGSNDSITIPNDPRLNDGTSYSAKTLSLWFYANDVSGRRVLYEQGGAGNGLNLYLDSGSVYVGVWSTNNGWGPYYVNSNVEANKWNHVTLVYDQSSNALYGYLNGISIGEVSGAGLLNSHSNANSIGQVDGSTLFHDSATGAVDYYDGRIDDMRAYNRALSASEVEALYSAGAF